MPRVAKGHIEQLPSGSFRVSVYAGMDPLTRRAIRLKSTVKTEQQAHIELGRLLKEASEGRTPESDATGAKLMDEYSTKNPATISDSPSGRSKGDRFVSARAEMKKTMNMGNSGMQNQMCRCARTISLRFRLPTQSSTLTMTKPIETS